MNTNNPNTNNTILVVKEGTEEGFMISRLDGKVLYDGPNDVLPEWAPEGLTNADLHERRQWYIARVGRDGMELLGSGDVLDIRDLRWFAFDGDTMEAVEIEADVQYRAETLAKLLGLTPEGQTHEENIAAFDKGFATKPSDIEVEVANSYEAHPTDAELLDPAHQGFEETEKAAQNG